MATQLELPTWGGKRAGAGRKRKSPLRRGQVLRTVRAALVGGAARAGFRLIHFSVQGNHLHLVVEAVDKIALSRGMQGLAVRIARP